MSVHHQPDCDECGHALTTRAARQLVAIHNGHHGPNRAWVSTYVYRCRDRKACRARAKKKAA